MLNVQNETYLVLHDGVANSSMQITAISETYLSVDSLIELSNISVSKQCRAGTIDPSLDCVLVTEIKKFTVRCRSG